MPYDVVVPQDGALRRAALVSGDGNGRYQAVIHATAGGPVTLSPQGQSVLHAYEDEFGVREVIAFGASPAAPPAELQDLAGATLGVTEAGKRWFRGMRGDLPVAGAFGYLGRPPGAAPVLPRGSGRTRPSSTRTMSSS